MGSGDGITADDLMIMESSCSTGYPDPPLDVPVYSRQIDTIGKRNVLS